MDTEKLHKHVADGVVREQRHASLPLSIFNYSERCQYDRLWDDVTLQCRGLVMHGDRVVAIPFRKFFNDTEHKPEELPWHLPCEVTEKLDGSLLIVFHFDGQWHYATRGSFVSEQAERGRIIFRQKYGEHLLRAGLTYLFEVIYPQNRIVVNYQEREDVVLLGVIHTESGFEVCSDMFPPELTAVRKLPPTANAQELRSIITDIEEGYVIRFENGFRVKVKGQRYIELHRIITGVSSRTIWEYLSERKSFDEMLSMVPDEFGDWVRREREEQLLAFEKLNERVESAYLESKPLPDRKSQAALILADYCDVSSAAFAALDGKPVAPILWKQLYPEFRRPEIVQRVES